MRFFSTNQSINGKISFHRVKSRQSGFALVLVLWVLSLLTIMAGSFALTMRRESTIVAGIKDNAGATAAAEAGIAYAETMLLQPDQNLRWRTDGNLYQIDFGSTAVRLRLLSEDGKININKADLTLLQSVMEHAPLEEDQQAKLIGAILDWRDQDDLLNIDGAEKDEYKRAGLKYQPRNKPFQTLEELQMVLGMDEKVYNWLLPLVTVYSEQPNVNAKVATTDVLSILPGLDASLIETYLATRLDNTKNDLPAPEFPGGSAANGVIGSNETLTIISEAQMEDENSALVVATVIKSPAGQGVGLDGEQSTPFKIVKWQRNPSSEKSLFSDEMSALLVKKYVETELSD